MRAAWYERTGPADEVIRVGECPKPEPGPGEVLVRVHASGINPSDTKRRAGWRGEPLPYPRIIPHSDGAGVVEAVGAGVEGTRVGERVWLYNTQRGRAHGTAAEYVALPAEQAVRLPDGTSFVEGACLGVPACTAHFAVFADGPVAGQTVLIHGGAGAVGHYAVQFAKRGGATVIATASTPEKAAHAADGGADHVLIYREENVVGRVREITRGEGVERIVEVDFGANLATDVEVIRPNGVIASYSSTRVPEPALPYYPLAYKGVTIRLVQAYILPSSARERAIRDITEALEAGELRNTAAAVLPLERTAEAHQLAEADSVIGTVVIDMVRPVRA